MKQNCTKPRNTTLITLGNGSIRVRYWVLDNQTNQYIRKSRDFAKSKKMQAMEFARTCKLEDSVPEEIAVSMEERIFLNRIKRYGNLDDILEYVAKNYTYAKSSIQFKLAYDEFIIYKKSTGRRQRTIDDYTKWGNKLKIYDEYELSNISESVAIEMLNTASKSLYQQKQASKYLKSFFNWAISQKYCDKNPFMRAIRNDTIKDRETINILSIDDVEKFLKNIDVRFRAGFAIMAFAGVRPSEIADANKPLLKWSDIDFENKKILIRAENAKTRTARILQELPANLWTWLNEYKSTGNIFPTYAVAKYRQKACELAGVIYSQDVLRHSFASYGYHHLGAEHTVEIMGHIGGFGVFDKHYKGLASKADSIKYFKIVPK